MRYFSETKKKVFILLSFFCICLAGLICVNTPNFALATNSSTQYFLPFDNLQYKSIDSPIDVYSDESVTAIVSGNQKLIVHYNDKLAEIDGFTAIKQIKKFNDKTLLVSDFGSIYSISLNDNFKKLELAEIGGNYFDINNEYLIAAYSGTAKVYKISGNNFTPYSSFSLDADKPVAINEKNEIFFYNSNGICKLLATKTNEKPIELTTDVPSKMIADNNFLYYLSESKTFVTKLSLSDLTKSQLEVSDLDKDYELGNLISPSGISFKNGNLLITDTELDAVQEFKIENNELNFTGFAIANGKTAYNRISKNAISVEYYDDKIAVLDQNKLLVAKTDKTGYDRENFSNYFKGENRTITDTNMPNAMALGKDSALLSFNHEKNNGYLKLLNLTSGVLSNKIDVNNCIIEEVCYQSGYYYVLLIRLEGSTHKETLVYKLSENAEELTENVLSSSFNSKEMTVDVFSNIYLSSSSGLVKVFEKKSGYKDNSSKTVGTIAGIEKMVTDLAGTLFVLTNNGIRYLDGNSFKSLTITAPETNDTIKSFAMSFEDKNVYLLFNNKEYVAKTTELNNLALSEVTVSNNDFITTAPTAEKDGLTVARVKEGANVYSVKKEKNGNRLIYDKLSERQSEYAYICEVKLSDKLSLFVLAGQDEIVLVNKNELTLSPVVQSATVPETAFITTDVNAYYIPIILKETNAETDFEVISFALNDGNTVRLKKGAQISPLSEITFLTRKQGDEVMGINYYFASFIINEKEYSGYIPVSFTVPVLSKDFSWKDYEIETVKKATVYKDDSLTESIYTLNDGDKVQVVENVNGVLKIKIQVNENGYIEGYIKSDSIKNEAQINIRNVSIIFIISLCVLGTSLFLILRKKRS